MRGGIIFQPTDWQSYYVSYGTSFNPSLEALTLTNLTQNPPPESNKSYEVGTKWDLLGGNLSVTPLFFTGDEQCPHASFADGIRARRRRPRRGFQARPGRPHHRQWQIFGGYTYMDGHVVKALDRHARASAGEHAAQHAHVVDDLCVTPQWEFGGGPVYMSPRYAANNEFVQVPAYTRWDAMAAFHQKHYDVQLNVLNLTNKHYYDALIQSDGGRAVPGFGRTLLATLNYRF